MTMSMQEVRSQLSSIEGDAQMYVDLGPDEVPLLVELLDDDEAWMASRAVYALARIATRDAITAVESASDSGRDEVRVAVAVSADVLPPQAADRVLTKLLKDWEVGVRKFAIGSVTSESDQRVLSLVEDMTDSEHDILRTRAQARARDLSD